MSPSKDSSHTHGPQGVEFLADYLPEMLLGEQTFAFLLSVIASMGTFVGGLVVIALVKWLGTDTRGKGAATLMGVLQAFSAGVMLYMTFVDLIPESSEKIGGRETIAWFFAGVAAFGILERWIMPEHEEEDIFETSGEEAEESNDDDANGEAEGSSSLRKRNNKAKAAAASPSASKKSKLKTEKPKIREKGEKNAVRDSHDAPPDFATARGRRELWRTSVITFGAMALHNLPEGLGVYLSALADVKLGLQLAVAIMLHNIPEGMAVAIPLYVATNGSVWKVLGMTLINGLAEPAGVVVGSLLLGRYLSPEVLSRSLAGVAGIMACISLHELQPTAIRYAGKDVASLSLFIGMFVCWVAMEGVEELMGPGHHH